MLDIEMIGLFIFYNNFEIKKSTKLIEYLVFNVPEPQRFFNGYNQFSRHNYKLFILRNS